jgi:geranylgeranyl diphosphate synthase, type I
MAELVDVEDLRPDVDAAISRRLSATKAEAAAVDWETTHLVDHAKTLLRGGKRFRAAFAYWSFRAHGGPDNGPRREGAIELGAALELFQAGALLHDDVLDSSAIRRGEPAAHHAFAARHRENDWHGDSDHFGISAAILLGDINLLAAEESLTAAVATSAPDWPHEAALRSVYGSMAREVMVGQYLDLLVQAQPWGADPEEDEDRARAVVQAKSASYSVRYPLVLGALLAGAGGGTIEAIDAFGLPLGEAFQLRDDVLGVFGDPAVTGKPAGDDLREGKRTVLVTRAYARANEQGQAIIRSTFGNSQMSDDDVRSLQSVIRNSGALDSVEQDIHRLAGRANDALTKTILTQRGREMLAALATAAIARDA